MRIALLTACLHLPFCLSAQEKGATAELHDISDVMESVRESLRRTDTGPKTQAQQEDVIARLQEMIDRLQEQSDQGSAGDTGQHPASKSGVPEGPSRSGINRPPVPTATQKWGGVKPEARAAIETELNAKLPPRYRRMLAQYFARLAKSGR